MQVHLLTNLPGRGPIDQNAVICNVYAVAHGMSEVAAGLDDSRDTLLGDVRVFGAKAHDAGPRLGCLRGGSGRDDVACDANTFVDTLCGKLVERSDKAGHEAVTGALVECLGRVELLDDTAVHHSHAV